MPASVFFGPRYPRKLGPALFDVRLDSLTFVEGASGHLAEQGLAIVTSPQQWAYSLLSPGLSEQGFTGEAVVRILGEFRGGKLGLAIAARENSGEFIIEVAADHFAQLSSSESGTSPLTSRWSRALAACRLSRGGVAVAFGLRTIDIPVPDLASAGAIIVRNQSDQGPSEATIRSIQVFRPEGLPCESLEKLGPALFDVSLDSLKFEEGTSGQVAEGHLAIVTSPHRWAYSLYSPALAEQGLDGEAVVRLQAEVRSGKLGLAIAKRENSGEFIAEFSAPPSPHLRTIDISVPDLTSAGAIILRNQSDEGPSEATIRSIQVFRPAPVSILSDYVAAQMPTRFAMQGLARATTSPNLLRRYCIVCGQDVERWVSFYIETSEFSRCIGAIGSNPTRLWCPHCRSTDRERHLLMFFAALRILARLTGGAVLHIAPEPSLVTAIRCVRPRHYVKGDLTPNHPSVEPIDVERIPYPDHTFDLAVCNHTLEHVTDPRRALSELRRILKPDARLICQTPYAERLSKTFEEPLLQSPEQRTFLYGQDDHLRTFGRDIVEIITAAGFAGRLIPHDEIIHGVDPEMLGVNELEPFFDFVAV